MSVFKNKDIVSITFRKIIVKDTSPLEVEHRALVRYRFSVKETKKSWLEPPAYTDEYALVDEMWQRPRDEDWDESPDPFEPDVTDAWNVYMSHVTVGTPLPAEIIIDQGVWKKAKRLHDRDDVWLTTIHGGTK